MTEKGIKLVKNYESLHDGDLKLIGLQPKMDSVGYWTEGYGRLMIDPKTKKPIRGAGNKKRAYELISIRTEAQANTALIEDSKKYERAVRELTSSVVLNEEQISALTSFSYNVGIGDVMKRRGGLAGSSLLRAILAHKSDEEIIHCFRMWNKAEGEVLNGLIYRRESEAILFVKGELRLFDNNNRPKI